MLSFELVGFVLHRLSNPNTLYSTFSANPFPFKGTESTYLYNYIVQVYTYSQIFNFLSHLITALLSERYNFIPAKYNTCAHFLRYKFLFLKIMTIGVVLEQIEELKSMKSTLNFYAPMILLYNSNCVVNM